MTHYQQLSFKERYQIQALIDMGWSTTRIAQRLKRHRSTIWREVKRNTRPSGRYSGGYAHNTAQARQQNAEKMCFKDTEIIRLIRLFLRRQWSPEQIAGYFKKQQGKTLVSHQWIYSFIKKDKQTGGKLYKHLRQASKALRKRYATSSVQPTIPKRRDIDDRPVIVDQRSRLGDWEGDTIVGSDLKSILVTLVERKSGLLRCARLERKFSTPVAKEIITLLKPIKKYVHTITFDNGTEFSRHQVMARALQCDIFFAKPYSSWQRGSNENTNGLIRQYFPKKTNFSKITEKELRIIINKINNRPRKRLGFLSPNEAFKQLKFSDALNS